MGLVWHIFSWAGSIKGNYLSDLHPNGIQGQEGPSNGARGHKFTSTIKACFLLNTLIKGYRLRPEVLEPVA